MAEMYEVYQIMHMDREILQYLLTQDHTLVFTNVLHYKFQELLQLGHSRLLIFAHTF